QRDVGRLRAVVRRIGRVGQVGGEGGGLGRVVLGRASQATRQEGEQEQRGEGQRVALHAPATFRGLLTTVEVALNKEKSGGERPRRIDANSEEFASRLVDEVEGVLEVRLGPHALDRR